ncbi:putative methyltransferase, partial [Lachnellula suecica]
NTSSRTRPKRRPARSTPPALSAHHELRTAENNAGYLLPKLQSLRERNPHLTLLDVGAGSGSISATLAKLIPDGHVTGVDLNPEILPRARAVAEMAGVTNIEFQQGSIMQLPFPDGAFDVTVCHQMLTHLKAPWDALSEMLRVTKQGGFVAAREGDLETECVWPELPGLLKFHKFAAGMMIMAGGSATGGRQLLSWALKAGVPREKIELSFSTWSYSTPEDRRVWAGTLIDHTKAGRLRDGGLKSGIVTESDLDEMAKDWEEWTERKDSSIAMMHGEIIIQK